MDPTQDNERTTRQMKAALDICVLAVVAGGETYGYEILAQLRRRLGPVKGGSIYSLLRRLDEAGLLESRLEESPSGPARRYYRITPEGTATLKRWAYDFGRFAYAAMEIMADGVDPGRRRRRRGPGRRGGRRVRLSFSPPRGSPAEEHPGRKDGDA